MTQNTSGYAGGFHHRIPLTFAATLFLTTFAAAQRSMQAPGGDPSSGPSVKVDIKPRNKLVFPYGIQTFDVFDKVKVGESVTAIPGWQVDGPMVAATIAQPFSIDLRVTSSRGNGPPRSRISITISPARCAIAERCA